jgi:hypothetical protein
MTSRERVITALDHREPDRVPIDLGGAIMSGIMARALHDLRRYYGLEEKPVRVYEVFQMLGEVEPDVAERLGVDVLPVEPPAIFFGLKRDNYKPWTLFDGTEVLMPGQFNVDIAETGDWLLHEAGDPDKPIVARMPKNGHYFDMPDMLSASGDFSPPPLDKVRQKRRLPEADLEFLQERAAHLRKTTDKALLLGCWGRLGLGSVGSWPDYLMLLAMDQDYIRDLHAVHNETAAENIDRLYAALGDTIDIVGLDGADYGGQQGELFQPAWFEELFAPYYKEQINYIHAHTPWKTWKHTCGSVPNLVPLLADAGLDILNPVQTSAAGMDAAWLKKTYGDRLTFWGGGVDTQKTLSFATPEEVAGEVAERIRIFAPGGGFVFNPIHNVQNGAPPENIAAAFETAQQTGQYPLA